MTYGTVTKRARTRSVGGGGEGSDSFLIIPTVIMALKCLVLCALLGAIDARMLPAREQMLALRGGGKAAPPPKPMITVPDGLSGIGGAAGVGGVLGFCAGKVRCSIFANKVSLHALTLCF